MEWRKVTSGIRPDLSETLIRALVGVITSAMSPDGAEREKVGWGGDDGAVSCGGY